ncbi:signal peptidase I [Natronomonas halophila]|uniref:signal peptidase I n=1 Tax=Natronomonas halophila TaxID=2747817 RepID=UPI0015B42FD3|nr:signal peptidase I [Natronomonas halophila]QLD86261.1 signal peptidase I [Natronomonas halophila]
MIRRALALVAVGGFLLLVLPGTPLQLSYVYSDSMEPTIGQGDGYIVGPAGDITAGDIITFDSESRGEYVTHRVVAVTDDGYITQGDNNPSTDQAVGHPVVTDESVVGTVLAVRGQPIVIPGLAGIASALSTYWPLGVLAVLLGGGLIERNPRARDLVRVNDLMTPLVFTAVVGTALALAYAVPTYTMAFTAVVTDDGGGRIIAVGESATRSFEVAAGPRFTYQFVEGSGVTVLDVVANGDTADVEIEVPAQSTGGLYEATVTTHYYPAVLPYRLVSGLHAIHPVAASFASIGTIVAPLYAVHRLVVDGRAPIVSKSRSRGAWWKPR